MFHLFLDVYCNRSDLDVSYVSHKCCNNMFQMFRLFQSYVAASCSMLQVASVLFEHFIAHVAYVASVSEACSKYLFKTFHMFLNVCYNRSDTFYTLSVPKYLSLSLLEKKL
jgi:hypothetical protein